MGKNYGKLVTRNIATFDCSQDLHNVAVGMVESNHYNNGSYKLKEIDGEMVNVWIADAHAEGNTEYAEFLRDALAKGATIYTLVDILGGFEQDLFEVVVY